MARFLAPILVALAALAGCGGGSKSAREPAIAPTTTAAHPVTTTAPPPATASAPSPLTPEAQSLATGDILDKQGGATTVTGKRVTLVVDRYYVWNNGNIAVGDLGTPQGVDNVDAYRLMIQSFRWS